MAKSSAFCAPRKSWPAPTLRRHSQHKDRAGFGVVIALLWVVARWSARLGRFTVTTIVVLIIVVAFGNYSPCPSGRILGSFS
jgi:MFS superfamily sulfate permease-like transporter